MNPHADNCAKNMGFACTCGHDLLELVKKKAIDDERSRISMWLSCEIFEARLDKEKVEFLRRLQHAICKIGVDPSVSLAEMDIPEFDGVVG